MAYAEKRGKHWSVRYKHPDGTWPRATHDDDGRPFTTKRAALAYGNALETDVRRKVFISPRDGRVTVAEWVERWCTTWEVDPASAEAYTTRLRSVILPYWGTWAIGDITASSYLAWRKETRARYSANYCRGIEMVMRMLLDDAAEDKLIGSNPMPSSKRRRGRYEDESAEDDYVFPHKPLQAVLVAENARVVRGAVGEAFVLTKAFTGMRLAELAGLRREFAWVGPDRDPWDQWIRVEWQGVHAQGGGFTQKAPKYGSRRTLILPPFLGTLLHEVLESHDREYVFPSVRGKALRTDDQFYGYFWHPIVDGHAELPQVRGRRYRPELPSVPGLTGMVPHGLRHGHRVWLEEDDIPPSAIDERMGHKVRGSGRRREGDSQAPGTYRHVTPAMRRRVAEALQRQWETAARERSKATPKIISQMSPSEAENAGGTPGTMSGRTPQKAG